MSDTHPHDENYPILSMLCNEGVIYTEIDGKHLRVEENAGNVYSLMLSANELKMLADELLRIAEILENKKDE